MQTATSTDARRLKRRALVLRDLGGWAVMLPGIILFLFYIWEPLLESLRLSFFTTKRFSAETFVWFDNYLYMMRHPDFLAALRNTFGYTVWSLVIGFLVPPVMAVIIHELTRGKNLLRTAIYLPNIVPGLATVFLWKFLFSADKAGGVNTLLQYLGTGPFAYLSNPTWVIPIIVLTMTWKGAGATTLIYLAGLQSINPEHYEAAIIDGAGVWQRMWNITVPNLFNLGRTLLILQIIAVFQILYEPFVMTNGGPNNASISLMLMVYRRAFEMYEFGRAAALSVIVAAILICLTLVYNKVIKASDDFA